MPRRTLPPFHCPRCGYEIARKSSIITHFTKLKTPCPALEDDIELTDEIKQSVLLNRSYKKPTKRVNIVKNIVNNYNQYNNINNIIAGMDVIEKLEQYLSFKKQDLIDLDTSVENKFMGRAIKFDRDEYVKEINDREFLEIVAEPLQYPNNDDENMHAFQNVIYDNKHKELKISDGTWESLGIDDGTRRYIEVIKQRFLDSYERYLLRTLKRTSEGREKTRFKEMLETYFAFIACFSLEPFCMDADDDEILRPACSDSDSDNDSDSDSDSSHSSKAHQSSTHTIEEEYYPLYKKVVKTLKKTVVRKTIKDVHDTIKRNSAKNVSELNKRITKLFQMEETFRDMLLSIQG